MSYEQKETKTVRLDWCLFSPPNLQRCHLVQKSNFSTKLRLLHTKRPIYASASIYSDSLYFSLFYSAKIFPLERFVFLAKSRRLRECTTSERHQSDSADGWIQISHPPLPLKQSSNLFLKGFCFICHGLPDYKVYHFHYIGFRKPKMKAKTSLPSFVFFEQLKSPIWLFFPFSSFTIVSLQFFSLSERNVLEIKMPLMLMFLHVLFCLYLTQPWDPQFHTGTDVIKRRRSVTLNEGNLK